MIAISVELLGFACERVRNNEYLLDDLQSTKSSLEVLLY